MQWEKDANEGLGLEAAPRDKNALDRLAEETGEEVKKLAMRYLRAAPGTYISRRSASDRTRRTGRRSWR